MEITINIPDTFSKLPARNQKRVIKKVEREVARVGFLEALENTEDAETDLTEREQTELIDRARQEAWDRKRNAKL